MLNFKHLRCFLALAEEGSLAKAGAKIFLSPQTIGGQIKELESRHGIELFRMAGRRLMLTEAGKALLPLAKEAFLAGSKIEEEAERWRAGVALYPFRAGFCPEVPQAVAAKGLMAVSQMKALASGMTAETGILAEKLASGKLDVAVFMGDPSGFYGRVEPLGSAPLAFAARNDLARKLAEDFPNSLSRHGAILPARGGRLRDTLESYLGSVGVRVAALGESSDPGLCKEMAEAGLGWCALPLPALSAANLSGDLSIAGIAWNARCELSAAWSPAASEAPVAKLFGQTLRAALAQDGSFEPNGEEAAGEQG